MVTSRVLCHCKKRGTNTLPQVLIGEHGIEYSFHARSIRENPHRPGSSSHLPKSTFNSIGSTDLRPEIFIGTLKEAQQVFLIVKQTCHCPGIDMLPSSSKRSNGHLGLSNTRGILDCMQITLNCLSLSFSYMGKHISYEPSSVVWVSLDRPWRALRGVPYRHRLQSSQQSLHVSPCGTNQ